MRCIVWLSIPGPDCRTGGSRPVEVISRQYLNWAAFANLADVPTGGIFVLGFQRNARYSPETHASGTWLTARIESGVLKQHHRDVSFP
jgi:hypothetical protein